MTPSPPTAQVVQGYSNGLDDQLVQLVRTRQPRARWWWGRRNWWRHQDGTPTFRPWDDVQQADPPQPQFGAWCYVCNQPIVTWSSRWPMTQAAKAAIGRHRLSHLQGALDAPATQESPK